MPHPWKADDLVVDGETEEFDAYYEKLVENDSFCDCCGTLDDTGDCPCGDWDDDCFIGKGRPWETKIYRSPYVRLSKKGMRLRAECRDDTREFLNAMERRGKVRKARRRWMVFKDTVDAKRVALFWQEQTQCNLCAPGGAGRAADAAAFKEEF